MRLKVKRSLDENGASTELGQQKIKLREQIISALGLGIGSERQIDGKTSTNEYF